MCACICVLIFMYMIQRFLHNVLGPPFVPLRDYKRDCLFYSTNTYSATVFTSFFFFFIVACFVFYLLPTKKF